MKAVDTAARTVTLDAVVDGTRVEVAIHVGPDTPVVRLTRAASVTTHHEGEREIARLFRILHEN